MRTTPFKRWQGTLSTIGMALAWEPAGYVAFLRHIITQLHLRPFATVAAGHAATYALSLAADAPGSLGRLCLIAPTWRGPLPTVMPGRRGLGAWIIRAGDLPIIGAVLYRINVNGPVVRMMARGHVYSDPNWLEGEPLQQKMAVTKAPGARYASIRFVTGMLDLISDRASFIELVKRLKIRSLFFTEPRHRAGQKQRWRRSYPSRASSPLSCRMASLRCTRNFPTWSRKR